MRHLWRKFKEQDRDEPQGEIPNVQDDDMGEAKVKLSIAEASSLPRTIHKSKRKPRMTDEVGNPRGKGTKFKKLKTEDL